MKGKVTCPKCSFVFVVESETEKDKKVVCPKCGYEFVARIGKVKKKDVRWIEYGGARKAILPIPENLSNRPFAAGVLLALASISSIVTVLMFYTYPDINISTPYNLIFRGSEIYLSAMMLVFSAFSAMGSYHSIKKKSITVALSGCVFGILSFGFLVVGPILSLAALILLLMSKDDFDKSLHGKEF